MSKKSLLILVVVLIGAIAIPLTLYLTNQRQDVRSRAQESLTPTPSCQIPQAVINVLVEYPSCEGTQCSSASASCKWDAVSGATNYSLKISQVESGEVLRNDTVSPTTLKVVFSVIEGKTYKCDVAAINSCGTGSVGTFSLLCGTQAAITSAPTATPVPTVAPTSTPPPVVTTCGNVCSSGSPCQTGLNCVQASNGQSYCSMPAYEQACKASPSYNACCTAPAAAAPTRVPIQPTGDVKPLIIGISSLAAFIIGGMIFLFAGL